MGIKQVESNYAHDDRIPVVNMAGLALSLTTANDHLVHLLKYV